jgi:plastocyanin
VSLMAPALLAAAAASVAPVTVKGTVVVTGQRTNAWAVVTLEAPGLAAPPPAGPVDIDQKGFRFLPHVVVIPVGGSVRFLNNDPEPHNVYSPEGRYNLGTWPPGESRDHRFEKPGVYSQQCNIHPDMLGFVVVVDTPYSAVTDASGAFEIRGVQPGSYRLTVWHEKKDGLEQDLTVPPGRPLELKLTVEK